MCGVSIRRSRGAFIGAILTRDALRQWMLDTFQKRHYGQIPCRRYSAIMAHTKASSLPSGSYTRAPICSDIAAVAALIYLVIYAA
jgi:hypothetical protein